MYKRQTEQSLLRHEQDLSAYPNFQSLYYSAIERLDEYKLQFEDTHARFLQLKLSTAHNIRQVGRSISIEDAKSQQSNLAKQCQQLQDMIQKLSTKILAQRDQLLHLNVSIFMEREAQNDTFIPKNAKCQAYYLEERERKANMAELHLVQHQIRDLEFKIKAFM